MTKDSRMVSFVRDLEENGALNEVVNFVKNSKGRELELCFRGNSQPESITVYKNNHKVWNIKKSDETHYEIEISLNHARYTSDWKYKLKNMIKENQEYSGKTCPAIQKNCCVGYFKSNKTSRIDEAFLKRTYSVINSFFSDYFDSQKNIDAFKKEKMGNSYVPTDKRILKEKIKQQELYTKILNGSNSDYLAYDLEFVQPKLKAGSNQPDMFAIKKLKDGKFKIVLVEVKSTEGACTGSSGLVNHLKGMLEYIKTNTYIEARKSDAINIVKTFRNLGLRGIGDDFDMFDEDISNNIFQGIEILFVFTGEHKKGAIDYCNRIKKAKSKTYKEFKAICDTKKNCEIVIKQYTDNGEFKDLIL